MSSHCSRTFHCMPLPWDHPNLLFCKCFHNLSIPALYPATYSSLPPSTLCEPIAPNSCSTHCSQIIPCTFLLPRPWCSLSLPFHVLFTPTCPSNSRPSKPSSVYTFHRDHSCPSILKLPVISLLIWCWLHDHSSLSVVSQKFSLVIKRFIYDSCFLWNIPMFCSLLSAYERHVSFSQSP